MEDLKNCGICNKILSKEDTDKINITDLMLTCAEHRKYREYSNNQVPKMELGIIKDYPLKWKKCEICECDLTKDDIDSFSKQTVNPTCKKHRIAYNWWQIDIAKDWFEYCDYVGFDLNYSEANSKGFQDWRIEKYKK